MTPSPEPRAHLGAGIALRDVVRSAYPAQGFLDLSQFFAWDPEAGVDPRPFAPGFTLELVAEEVDLVSPGRQFGLFFTERASSFLEPLPHFVLTGLGPHVLALDHNDEGIGVANVSHFAGVPSILRKVWRCSLLPLSLDQFSDARLSCSS
jgi:hypothetical protein